MLTMLTTMATKSGADDGDDGDDGNDDDDVIDKRDGGDNDDDDDDDCNDDDDNHDGGFNVCLQLVAISVSTKVVHRCSKRECDRANTCVDLVWVVRAYWHIAGSLA